ncbi:PepSY domain-containing protein [Siculibacillus lacustris]|uniref:PepSY domain-containing protein n=2 Tax=Siculibacillus lacustris TaxID=1549641 RepID=A0A4Q9VFT4_9HYPH|nr:PepSY domain-containing protein [Siculibacillus lacustris]
MSAGAGLAEPRCDVPLADWQPREALQKKLEADGWTAAKIRSDDGCYKAIGRDGRGEIVKGRFDPATLERLEDDGRDDHGGHGRHGRRWGADD